MAMVCSLKVSMPTSCSPAAETGILPTGAGKMTSIPLPRQASAVYGQAKTNCPYLKPENSTYTAPGSNIRFKRECGPDYPGEDIGQVPMTRMEDCLNMCAALRVSVQSSRGPCMGVSWRTETKQGQYADYCCVRCAGGAPAEHRRSAGGKVGSLENSCSRDRFKPSIAEILQG
ncbi:hypothetical protein CPLU01_13003 [Colletotrichum plurivorum]|uniref:WSC domain-containing protein n=1 Tax=Colletotrichum plurivorum TaxID=2175906 RepID=A0A8H6JUV7_9PEZI|nr:hypothetical protein CPLU01_13003 [Colletotrichum plurivorum]